MLLFNYLVTNCYLKHIFKIENTLSFSKNMINYEHDFLVAEIKTKYSI